MFQQDRRHLVRWQIGHQAKLQIEGEQEKTECLVEDINFLGCKLILTKTLKQDKHIKITLEFSEDFIFEIEVWVVWHKVVAGRNIYGVFFTRIRDEDKERLHQFIQRKIPNRVWQQWWQETTDKKGGAGMDDRRIFARFSARFPTRLLNLSNGEELTGYSQDICAKGVGVVTQKLLQPDAEVELWLDINDGKEPVYSRGKVVWTASCASGFRSGISLEKANLMGLSRVMRCILP